MTPVAIAFLPLTDSAPLIVAQRMGFAEAQGIDLTLQRTTSWATVRDRLVYGQVQAAHMLAPLAIAVTLGLSQHPAALAAPFKLNVNGNANAIMHSQGTRTTCLAGASSANGNGAPVFQWLCNRNDTFQQWN